MAISHDIEFCEAINPTHIARVDPNGSVEVSLCINGDLSPPKAKGKPAAATKGTKKAAAAAAPTPVVKSYGGAAHVKPVVAAPPNPKRIHEVN